MKLVKDPLIGKVTFDGKYIYNEGKCTYKFAVDSDEYFKDNEDEDFSKESTTEKLITELHQLFSKPKTRYHITSITLSYDELTWTLI